MKKIKGYFHISKNDYMEFNKAFEIALNKLQDDGQEVEIQYNTQVVDNPDKPIVYSALLIGRVEDSG